VSDEATWYDVLGVAPTATADEIRAAHRARSKASHPDAGGSTAQFQLVQRAYEVLSAPERRSVYDRELRGEPPPPRPASRPSPAPATVRMPHPGPVPPEPAQGCLRPWVAIGGAVAVVVAVLVVIATLSSSNPGPSATSDGTGPRPPAAGTAAPHASTTAAAGGAADVTTSIVSDLPAGFPRGHVPLPSSARLGDAVLAAAPGAPVVYTIRATGSGTDPERAALNYATTLQAAGWTPAASPDDEAGGDSQVVQRSFTDADGARLQFTVTPADDGGLDYLIGFQPVSR
jgi:hypothetical protein